MAREIVTKSKRFYCVSQRPDICKTPVGNSMPPIPYGIKGEFAEAQAVSPNISSHSDKVVLHDRSYIPTVTGDRPGSGTGIKSGTVGQRVQHQDKSRTVHFNGTDAVREGDVVRMNDNNTIGTIHERDGEAAKPPITQEAAVEPSPPASVAAKPASLWEKASPWVHGTLGLASFVPGLSIATGGLDAAIYAGEGNLIEAGLSGASMIPGGKWVTTAGKVVKGAAGLIKGAHVTEEAVKVVKVVDEVKDVAKVTREVQEAAKAVKQTEEEVKLAREAKTAREAEEAREAAKAKAKGKDGGKSKGEKKKKEPGPCDHLRQGSGTGPYRGGAHSKTSGPKNDGKDSHHMPADDASPLLKEDGPAIQMDPTDHRLTKSNGSQPGSAKYRQSIEALLQEGKWRDAVLKEILDIRRIQNMINNPGKYNEAMLEMLEYFKCLEKNGLLPEK